jgi:hypothetical protein
VKYVKFARFKVRVPAHPVARIAFGVLLCLGGLFSFLPILGVWMLPLGLIILSVDSAAVRRFRRRSTVKLGRWIIPKWPKTAEKLGYSVKQFPQPS